MVEQIIESVGDMLVVSFFISIFANIAISVVGVIPSVFITAFNVAVFGMYGGVFVGFIGEAVGSGVAFFLYRKGFRKFVEKKTERMRVLNSLLHVTGVKAFLIIFLCRLLPFVPSSLVTLYAALGKITFPFFIISSTLGKIPALVMETLSTYVALSWIGSAGFTILLVVMGVIVFLLWFIQKKKSSNTNVI